MNYATFRKIAKGPLSDLSNQELWTYGSSMVGGGLLGWLMSRVVHKRPTARKRLLWTLLGIFGGGSAAHAYLRSPSDNPEDKEKGKTRADTAREEQKKEDEVKRENAEREAQTGALKAKRAQVDTWKPGGGTLTGALTGVVTGAYGANLMSQQAKLGDVLGATTPVTAAEPEDILALGNIRKLYDGKNTLLGRTLALANPFGERARLLRKDLSGALRATGLADKTHRGIATAGFAVPFFTQAGLGYLYDRHARSKELGHIDTKIADLRAQFSNK